MLLVFQAVGEQLNLRLVGDAGQHRIIVGKRYLGDRPVARLHVDRIDGSNEAVAGNTSALVALHPQARDHDTHRQNALR